MASRAIDTPNAAAFPTILSQGRVAGNMLYVSGCVAVKPGERGLASTDFKEQVRVTLQNLKAICQASGTNMDRVVKTTIFLTDMRHYAAMNDVYKEFFKQPMPARSCVAVSALGIPGLMIEIEAIAELPA